VKLIEPTTSDGSEPFWDGTRRHEFLLPWCRACDAPFWYPREVCPRCLGTEIEWRPAAGAGEVYAVSVQHRPGPGRDEADGLYAVALVDLAEGVRVMGNVLNAEPESVRVGQAVRVTWQPLRDGRNLPQFEPA